MVVGDYKKFLTALVTLKVEMSPDMSTPTRNLTENVKKFLKSELNIANVETTKDAVLNDEIIYYIQKKISENNKLSISRAQHIRRFKIILDDFSMEGGELTPTLKLKRKVVLEKYKNFIEEMYDTEEVIAKI